MPPPWLGVRFVHHSPRLAEVFPGTPAARAGLEAGDRLVAVDGRAIAGPFDFVRGVRYHRPGDVIHLVVVRHGRRVGLSATLAHRPNLVALARTLVGRPAPDFALPAIAGRYPAALGELAGDVVIVEFFATWCHACRYAAPHLDALQRRYGARGLRVVAISSEAPATIRRYSQSHRVAYTIARDPAGRVAAAYARVALPMLIVIDRTGIVRYAGVGAGDFDAIEAVVAKLLG